MWSVCQKDTCIKGLVSNLWCYWQVIGSWGLIHWWVHTEWFTTSGGAGWRKRFTGVLGHTLVYPSFWSLPLSFCFPDAVRWTAFSVTCSQSWDVLPHHRPFALEPANHWLKPLKLWNKIDLYSFKLFLSGICCSDGHLSNTGN
jgi:hypothetical protein